MVKKHHSYVGAEATRISGRDVSKVKPYLNPGVLAIATKIIMNKNNYANDGGAGATVLNKASSLPMLKLRNG